MGNTNVSNGRIYLAYGSNLNLNQMSMRCSSAKVISEGVLNDYALRFKGRPYSSFLTIEKLKGSKVPVLLWQLKAEDEVALDIYEGVQLNHYSKQNIDIELKGKNVSALTYIMNPKFNYGIPSDLYYKTVYEGYRNCGFPVEVLEQAYTESFNSFSETYEDQSLLDLIW